MKVDSPLKGIFPANLLPFDKNLDIDESSYRKHLRHLCSIKGVSGVVTNAHASEVATLDWNEQEKVLSIAVEEIGAHTVIVSGIYCDGTRNAKRLATLADKNGADCLLIFPSQIYSFGSQLKPEMAYTHIASIAEVTNLPFIIFVYPIQSDLHINTENLIKICTEIDNVVAIKEWSNDITVYERNFRHLKSLDKQISILTSFSRALLASLCIGADGILSGHGSIIADLQSDIFFAVEDGNLEKARAIASKIFDLTEVFYDDPFLDMHNRMKEAAALLGRIDAAYVRPPLTSISSEERERIKKVLNSVGMLP